MLRYYLAVHHTMYFILFIYYRLMDAFSSFSLESNPIQSNYGRASYGSRDLSGGDRDFDSAAAMDTPVSIISSYLI